MSKLICRRACGVAANAERRLFALLDKSPANQLCSLGNRTGRYGQLAIINASGQHSLSTHPWVRSPYLSINPPRGSWNYWERILVAAAAALPIGCVVFLRSANSSDDHQRGDLRRVQPIESPAQTGKIEDFYALQDNALGYGKSGTVCSAVDKITGEIVAVKRVPRCNTTDKSFDEEIAAHRHAGQHPNIVGLKGVFSSKDCWYVVMELANGGELYDRLTTKGALQRGEVRGLFREMVDAVAHLHAKGVVHGDIKPENVLLRQPQSSSCSKPEGVGAETEALNTEIEAVSAGADGKMHHNAGPEGSAAELEACKHAVLADFGSSFRLGVDGPENDARRAAKQYTVAYSAPEVVSEGSVDRKADVWSLGVIAYIMVKGYHPFDPTSEAGEDEIVANVVHADPDWEGLEPQVADTIRQMLSRNPNERPSAREVLESSWLQITDHAQA